MDLELKTGGTAFYPRPETELLVEKAIELMNNSKNHDRQRAILDIGTGSGNIAISLTKYISSSRIIGLDISEDALRVAYQNAEHSGVADKIKFIKSNLFEKLGSEFDGYFDMVISNPPYISLKDFCELPENVKDDPYIALYGGRDGLDFYREIVSKSPRVLGRDGIIILEIGYDQGEQVRKMLEENGGFSFIELFKDYSGLDRIIKAVKNG